ncbi:TPA: hypothetical protein VAK88_006002 [Pseudomonas aeruginosa]|nr:hypothetical protein [Pseudomonas aeruginosa]
MTTPIVQSISDEQLAELEGYSQHPAFLGDEDSAITMGELRGLIARLRAAEADAKRYRWLRSQPNDCSAPRIDICHWQRNGDDSVNEGEGLRLEEADKAIDAAMERTQ